MVQIFNYNSFINEELRDNDLDFNIFDKSMIQDSLQELEDNDFDYKLSVSICFFVGSKNTRQIYGLISDDGEPINRKRIAEAISALKNKNVSGLSVNFHDYISPSFFLMIEIPDDFKNKSKLFSTLSRVEEKLANYDLEFTQDDRYYKLIIADKKRYSIS